MKLHVRSSSQPDPSYVDQARADGQPGCCTPVNGAAHVEFQRVRHARVCADVLVYLICVAPVHLHAANRIESISSSSWCQVNKPSTMKVES